MKPRKTGTKNSEEALDRFSNKRGRGRPRQAVPSVLIGRAGNYRGMLSRNWEVVGAALAEAQTEEDVIKVLDNVRPSLEEFRPIASLILQVVRDPNFPKRSKPRINFLADSIAAYGAVRPRRSRDICNLERARTRKANHILRAELYIECSCRYKGPSLDHRCPKCKADIPFNLLPAGSPILGVT
jgi:hypothetical protein